MDLPRAVLDRHADRALDLLAHRGPNGSGKLLGPGWVMAHRRLAVFDVSPQGGQPMQGWGLTVIFNGAIYNYRELRRALEGFGYIFQSDSDTEVLLAAYHKWGTDCFPRLNGMWAVAILNHTDQTLVLSRDRFGIKPLYYTSRDGLTFASEPRAVAETLAEHPGIDRRVGREFVVNGWQDHRPETLFRDIRQFPPGHYGKMDLTAPGKLEVDSYYDLGAAVSAVSVPPDERTAQEEFLRLLTSSVMLRTRSDVGRCLTLSGGVDSSSIAGLVAARTGLRPATFSALFPGTPYDESPYVRAVNQMHDLVNYPYLPEYADFLRSYTLAQRAQGQPLGSLAVVIHYALMERIRNAGETVLLNGQGADEIGAGYDKFYLALLREQGARRPLAALATAWNYLRHHRVDAGKIAARLAPGLGFARHAAASMVGPYFSDPETPPFRRSRDADVQRTAVNLMREVGLPVLLRHEDRNTMAMGLESRVPFLDHQVVEFMVALPSHWKIRRGVRKFAIREACRDVLPREVYRRYDKLGFATPSAAWMERDADRFRAGIKAGVELDYFTEAALTRCDDAFRYRRTGEYNFVFRCWAWTEFMEDRQSSGT